MSTKGLTLDIPPSVELLDSTLGFITGAASAFGASPDGLDKLKGDIALTLKPILSQPVWGDQEEKISVRVSQVDGKLKVEIVNLAKPILRDLTGKQLNYQNNGRNGQIFSFIQDVTPHASISVETSSNYTMQDIEFRVGRPSDAEAISQLFYEVYGYNYINDFIYYPNQIEELFFKGDLRSQVALLPDGKMIGHVGLRRWGNRAYEASLGVINPRIKVKGLFTEVFARTMSDINSTPMDYCFFDFVTNHDYSQRILNKYNISPIGLLVGCQSKKTQASLKRMGIGDDFEEMNRYTLLIGVLSRSTHPFGTSVTIPGVLGEFFGFIFENLNMEWNPSPRFEPLAKEGEVKSDIQPMQHAIYFDMSRVGRTAVKKIEREWNLKLEEGFQYAAVDIPIDQQGIGQVLEILSASGFFIGGFVPYNFSTKLAVRLQALAPTRVNFDKIYVYSEAGKNLWNAVKESYERNAL